MADGLRIVQVLNNLLANAARHSPAVVADPGWRRCATGCTSRSRSPTRARGWRRSGCRHLFRGHTRTGAAEAGGGLRRMGLGLAICKGLVEAHGGRIRAESDGLGRGTRFTFTLPVDEAAVDGAAAGRGA